MMNIEELLALRSRLVAARANKQSIGAAEAYVAELEAEVSLVGFNSRRASVQHLLALVDATIKARTAPLRGRTETAEIIDEAAFSVVEPPPPVIENKPAAVKKRRRSKKPPTAEHVN